MSDRVVSFVAGAVVGGLVAWFAADAQTREGLRRGARNLSDRMERGAQRFSEAFGERTERGSVDGDAAPDRKGDAAPDG